MFQCMAEKQSIIVSYGFCLEPYGYHNNKKSIENNYDYESEGCFTFLQHKLTCSEYTLKNVISLGPSSCLVRFHCDICYSAYFDVKLIVHKSLKLILKAMLSYRYEIKMSASSKGYGRKERCYRCTQTGFPLAQY